MRKLNLKPLIWALGLVLIVALAAYGQINTAKITGAITDPSRAPVPRARIQVFNENTGFTKTADSTSSGEFTFDFLPIGIYTLTVEASGFQKLERKGVSLAAGEILGVNLRLKLGAVTQTVTVSGQSPLLNHESSNQLLTISNTDVRQLPQAKLDWSALANIGTGMRQVPVAGAPTGNSTISMNGLPGEGMSITLDGSSASGTLDGPSIGFYTQPNIINTVNTDAIQEISVNKGIMPASVGGTLSGNVNLISKGGTNQFHGDAYEVNSVAVYNARNQFLKTKPGFTFNQFGGSLGGPIRKDKLFFFGSYEGVRNNGFQAINTNIPSPYLESISPTVYTPIFKEFPSAPQPANNPTALSVQYITAGASVNNDLNTMERMDYYISPSNQLTARYVHARPYKLSPSVVVTNPEVWNTHNDMLNSNFLHTQGNWTSATRFGYNNVYYDRLQLGLNSDEEGVSLSGIFGSPQAEDSRQLGYYWTAMEDLGIIRGRHSIQFGGIVQRQQSNVLDLNTASFSYSTLSDFLNNTPTQSEITYPVPLIGQRSYQVGAYIQDDVKATRNLTLNLGLRYDIFTVPQQKDGLLFNRGIDPARPYLGPGFGDYLPPSSIYNGDHNNFQPRAGFSWTLGADRKTVIRGGSGIFVCPTSLYNATRTEMQAGPNIPFRIVFSRSQLLAANVTYPLPVDQLIPSLRAMQSGGILSSNLASYTVQAQNNPDPYTIQWMFDVERELGWGTSLSVGYIGNRGLKLILWRDENLPDRISGVMPDPTFTTFVLSAPIDSSTYHSLQVSVNKRFEHGLSFQASYTHASDTAYCGGGLAGRCYPQDNNNIRADLGPTAVDIRNDFNTSFVYQLPLQNWTGWHQRASQFLLSGWQLSGIFIAQDGLPFSIGNPGSIYPADRADEVPGVSPYLTNYHSTLQYLNPAAFATIPIVPVSGASVHPGTSGRNAYFYPGMWNLDSMVSRTFAITERVHLQVHGDMFNTFNHTNLTGIAGSLNAINFGQLTSATSRSIQIGARLEF